MKEFQNTVLFGDSITQFWSDFDPNFFVSYALINRGISGQTTTEMVRRFENDVITNAPKKVVLLAGINDIAENKGPITLEAVLYNIQIMVIKAMQHNIEVILCSLLPSNRFYWNPKIQPADSVIALNAMIRNYAEANGLHYVDYYTVMVDSANGLQEKFGKDGVHPNLEGYLQMKNLLIPYL